MNNLPIKIVLILLLFVGLRLFLVQSSLQLIKRVSAILLFSFLIVLVLFPDLSTVIANSVGIGRGVDLTFYLSHLFLLLLVIILWRRLKAQDEKITQISREMAIRNARKPEKRDRD
jgi:hypothetical protein